MGKLRLIRSANYSGAHHAQCCRVISIRPDQMISGLLYAFLQEPYFRWRLRFGAVAYLLARKALHMLVGKLVAFSVLDLRHQHTEHSRADSLYHFLSHSLCP